jgi:hypothetical protein
VVVSVVDNVSFEMLKSPQIRLRWGLCSTTWLNRRDCWRIKQHAGAAVGCRGVLEVPADQIAQGTVVVVEAAGGYAADEGGELVERREGEAEGRANAVRS